MRMWDVSGPEVEAADAAPWTDPKVVRAFSTLAMVRLAMAAATLYALTGVGALVLTGADAGAVEHPDLWFTMVGFAFAYPVLLVVLGLTLSPAQIRRQ